MSARDGASEDAESDPVPTAAWHLLSDTMRRGGEVTALPDATPDRAVAGIVDIAARVTGAPKAFVTMIEGATLHVMASVGSDTRQSEAARSVCSVVCKMAEPLVVPDLSADPRFSHYPYVQPEDGQRFYAGFPIRLGDGQPIGTLCVIDTRTRAGLSDVERGVMEALTAICVRVFEGMRGDARLSDYLDIASDWIWEQDSEHRFTFLSRGAVQNGVDPARVLGRTRWEAVIGSGETPEFWARHKADLDARRPFRDLRVRWFPDGREQIFAVSGRPVFGQGGLFLGYRGTARDVTLEEQARRQVELLANRDPLTGLANRRCFEARVTDAIRSWEEDGRSATLFLIDIDHFKLVNDTHGHSAGDALLIEIARRLKECAGPDAAIARLGGDEFAILEPSLTRDGAIAEYAAALGRAIAAPLETGQGIVQCGSSMGIAVLPDHGASFGQIVGNADLALYQSKSFGRQRFTLFDPEMRREADLRNTLTRELGEAIDRAQFQLVYQPVVSIRGEAVIGAEALLRWDHPARGVLPPGAFLSVLDGSRYAADVGYWVLEQACTSLRGWRGASGEGFRLAINLFSGQLRDPRLVHRVRSILERTGFDGRNLELEITEDILLAPMQNLAAVLGELKQLGVSIVLDDFGTGFGSLTHLLQFSIDRIKVDRAFVQGLGASLDHNTVTQSIVKLAADLGLKVTAEGIETEDQRRFLESVGCHNLQGFHFSRPVALDRLAELLEASRHRLAGAVPPDTRRHAGVA